MIECKSGHCFKALTRNFPIVPVDGVWYLVLDDWRLVWWHFQVSQRTFFRSSSKRTMQGILLKETNFLFFLGSQFLGETQRKRNIEISEYFILNENVSLRLGCTLQMKLLI